MRHCILTVSFLVCWSSLTWGAPKAPEAATPPKSHFESLELFNKILHLVSTQYYREVDTDKLIEGAVKGMLETLDPHSAFLGKDAFSKMQDDTRGEFGGIGIEVTSKEGVIYITTPIDDTPAFHAGLRPGDRIVEIDHESIMGMTVDEAVEKMRGKPGEKISIGIVREGEKEGVRRFDLVREIIKIKPVKYEVVENNYGFIRLTQFQKRSGTSIAEAIRDMEKKTKESGGLRGIILDLRYNPGGLLDEAVEVASVFLADGVVVSTEGRDPKQKDIRYVDKTIPKYTDIPLVVLVNGASASASEIVAGALQDTKRGIIMGTTSFGKGSVQTVAKVDDQNGIKLTIAQYLTPKGRRIQAVGIVPDIELDEFSAADMEENRIATNFIRERDLKNHLTSTIENSEEKSQREKDERIAKARRIEEIKKKKSKKSKEGKSSKEDGPGDDELFKKYDPKTDYQVKEAVSYLKAFKVFKEFETKR